MASAPTPSLRIDARRQGIRASPRSPGWFRLGQPQPTFQCCYRLCLGWTLARGLGSVPKRTIELISLTFDHTGRRGAGAEENAT